MLLEMSWPQANVLRTLSWESPPEVMSSLHADQSLLLQLEHWRMPLAATELLWIDTDAVGCWTGESPAVVACTVCPSARTEDWI